MFAGVYIYYYLVIGWLGERYDDLFRKSANIRGRGRKIGKKDIFTAPRGKI